MAEGGQDDDSYLSSKHKHSTPCKRKTKPPAIEIENESDNDASTSRVDDTSDISLDATSNMFALTPSDIRQIWFGQSTTLKYKSGKNDKRTDVIRSRETHAEQKMLNRIYKKALLELLKVNNTTELQKLSEQLEKLRSDVDTKKLPQLNQDIISSKEQLTRLKEHENTQLKLREKIKGRKKELDKRQWKEDETLQELRQKLKEVAEFIQKLPTIEKIKKRDKKIEKRQNTFKKLQPEVVIVLKHLAENSTELDKLDKALKELPHLLHEIAVLQKYMLLPQEFWVSKSPCADCAAALIQAYVAAPDKPTIHVASIYEGNINPLITLMNEDFKVKIWDLEKEYRNFKKEFEELDDFLKYPCNRGIAVKKLEEATNRVFGDLGELPL